MVSAVPAVASADIVLQDAPHATSTSTADSSDPMQTWAGSSGSSTLSSNAVLGYAGGSATTGSAGTKGLCAVTGSAWALAGYAGLGCSPTGPGTIG
ncbi:hypothetical protein [Nocardia sp. NPDC020380]|uniref:hypothetical protein n=1 Tax=Nocardia sp. NPDC020380 TaxID=3364309 RepID=UPI0037BA2102